MRLVCLRRPAKRRGADLAGSAQKKPKGDLCVCSAKSAILIPGFFAGRNDFSRALKTRS